MEVYLPRIRGSGEKVVITGAYGYATESPPCPILGAPGGSKAGLLESDGAAQSLSGRVAPRNDGEGSGCISGCGVDSWRCSSEGAESSLDVSSSRVRTKSGGSIGKCRCNGAITRLFPRDVLGQVGMRDTTPVVGCVKRSSIASASGHALSSLLLLMGAPRRISNR